MLRRFTLLLLALLAARAGGEILPDAPIIDFKLPRFADNGYTQWVLKGGKGIYESKEQATIVDMELRVYTADERMAVELTLESPLAVVRLEDNAAFSDQAIRIVGENFEITGVGWEWNGADNTVRVHNDVVVRYFEEIGNLLASGPAQGSRAVEGPAGRTTIASDQLQLTTSDTAYLFDFQRNVTVESKDMRMTADRFEVDAKAPEGELNAGVVSDSTIRSVNRLLATGKVTMREYGRVATCEECEFLPGSEVVQLRGLPEIRVDGAFLSGAAMQLSEGQVKIEGGPKAGRAQLILANTGGLGIAKGAQLSDETIVLADAIDLSENADENRFVFNGAVLVMSGPLQTECGELEITTRRKAETGEADTETIAIGDVTRVVARDAVRIRRGGELATCTLAEFFPVEERAVLSGDPVVANDEFTVTAQRMELLPNGAEATGGSGPQRVRVELPEMPDMGYDLPVAGAAVTGTATEPIEPRATTIFSRSVKVRETAEKTLFQFDDEVTIEATNLEANCDVLYVSALSTVPGAATLEEGDVRVSEIEGKGTVEILQQGRRATAERVLIEPLAGKVYLEGNPVVTDPMGSVSGRRIVLNQGERRAVVEGDGTNNQRARITIPEFKGFDQLKP